MSDSDGKKPLGLGAPRSGSVKQSFSHGRTHAVVVETKRKRVGSGGKACGCAGRRLSAGGTSPVTGDPSRRPAGISEAEMQRRLDALRQAKAREQEEAAKRAADERRVRRTASAAARRSRRRNARIASERPRCAPVPKRKSARSAKPRKRRETAPPPARRTFWAPSGQPAKAAEPVDPAPADPAVTDRSTGRAG